MIEVLKNLLKQDFTSIDILAVKHSGTLTALKAIYWNDEGEQKMIMINKDEVQVYDVLSNEKLGKE